MDKEVNREKIRNRTPLDPVHSPLSAHLAHLQAKNPKGAAQIRAIIIDLFTSDNGLKFMNLLDIAVLQISLEPGVSDSALRELNAQRNFVNDLRRIIAYGNA